MIWESDSDGSMAVPIPVVVAGTFNSGGTGTMLDVVVEEEVVVNGTDVISLKRIKY